MTMIVLFANVPVPALTLYFAVKVVLPAVSPVTKNVALDWVIGCWLPPLRRLRACVSAAARVVAPEIANPMLLCAVLVLFVSDAVTVTIALPEAAMVTVTAGPAVVKSAYVVLVVV
jgi:hypothetical protein